MAGSQPSSQGTTQTTQPLTLSIDADDGEAAWARLCPTRPIVNKYRVVELTEQKYVFGRDENQVDIVLKEPQISSTHCRIEFCEDHAEQTGCAWVHDLSTNGTYINKNKIGKGKKRMMFDGDELVFIQYAKKEKRTGRERQKVSFIFYVIDADDDSKEGIEAKYDIRGSLGQGSFAVVKLGVQRATGRLVAVKEIDKQKYQVKSKDRKNNSIMNESEIMRQVDHKNIIKVFDVFDTPNTLYLVLEMAHGGELFHKILENKKLDEHHSRIVMTQLLDAIMYLHSKKIAHRDLKVEFFFFLLLGFCFVFFFVS